MVTRNPPCLVAVALSRPFPTESPVTLGGDSGNLLVRITPSVASRAVDTIFLPCDATGDGRRADDKEAGGGVL